ncbi:MAG: carbohydrate porin [Planctomycetes bacterium]|nr:carbohydrate porin [Planctomycetota bacterium]
MSEEELAPFSWRYATGDWGGFRSRLRNHGVLAEASLITDASWVAAGGRHPGEGSLRALLDLTLAVDTGRALGIEGGTWFADFMVQRGRDGSRDTGDLQAYSNIDSEDRTQLALLWYEHALLDDRLRVKLGKIDANSDFAFVEQGFRFVHSSFGVSPTVLGLPTYPDSAFGALAFVRPGGGAYAGVGIFDGATQRGRPTGPRGPGSLFGEPSDLFLIAEAGMGWRRDADDRQGRLGIGAWRHTGDFARFDGGTEDGTSGFYVVLDQLFVGSDVIEEDRDVGAFVQYGWADPGLSAIEHHLGAGMSIIGPFAARPRDAAGLGISYGAFSETRGADLRGRGELAAELFYTIEIAPSVRVKPDLQWIHNPGGDGTDDAWVLTVRTSITF